MTVDSAVVIDQIEQPAPIVIDGSADGKRIRRKKSRGPFGFFRAISTVLITNNDAKNKKPPPIKTTNIDDDENDTWKNIVGSMRPLHLQQGLTSPSPDHHHHLSIPDYGHYAASSPSPSFSSGTMSQYASASNLVALGEEMVAVAENDGGVEDPDEVFDAITGDEMIDSKAEEFIARFYSQIKVDSRRHQRNRTAQF